MVSFTYKTARKVLTNFKIFVPVSGKIEFTFRAKIWQHSLAGGWHFVSLPKKISKEIREGLQWQEEGWGRMKVLASVEGLKWNTSIWYDTKAGTYLLPIKAEIRRKLSIEVDESLELTLWI